MSSTTIRDNDFEWVFWNIYNFDISSDAMSNILAEVRSRHRLALSPRPSSTSSAPTSTSSTRTTRFSTAVALAPRLEHVGLRRHQRQWQRILADFGEISVDEYTFYNLANRTFSRLDKIFVRLPPWAMTSLKSPAGVAGDLLDLRRRSISDHAPLALDICPRSFMLAASRPVPRHLPAHPLPRLRARLR